MPGKKPPSHSGELLDETTEVTLAELTRMCRVHAEWVTELVDEGVLEPLTGRGAQWRFSSTSIVRIERARRLQRDLGVNLAGIALALQLIDRIDALEARLRGFGELPPPVDHDD
jgi:chaperone modulatory protein CbpM